MNNSSVAFPNYCSLSCIHWTIDGRVTDNFFKLTSDKDASGPGSVVGSATVYGLDGPGIESR